MAANSVDTKIEPDYCLGSGAYGTVYMATYGNQRSAVKVLDARYTYPTVQESAQLFEVLLKTSHPNLVRYLGRERVFTQKQLALYMELATENLTTLLQRSEDPLPYHVQVDLCHDISSGVAHFHSMGVIHKHLSSNNILIAKDGTAKVTDYAITPLIKQPRQDKQTEAYMPPQFFRGEQLQYTSKFDTFSLGVLAIQICTRRYPNPDPRCVQFFDNSAPIGIAEHEVKEIERRRNHLEIIERTNPIREIAEHAINNGEIDRPIVQDIVERLLSLKREYAYAESVGEVANNKSLKAKMQEAIQIDFKVVHDNKLSRGNSVVMLNTAYFRTGVSLCSYNFITKEWKELPNCLYGFCSIAVVRGLVTTIGGLCETTASGATNKLVSLVENPEGNGLHWEERFKPMPTERGYSMAVSIDTCLVVAAGTRTGVDSGALRLVEVMDLNTLAWSTAKSKLPGPLSWGSMTICDDKVYILGGKDDHGRTRAAYMCAVADLISDNVDGWKRIADTPAYNSTCESVRGHLIAVGGCNAHCKEISHYVYKYNPYNDSWETFEELQLSAPHYYSHAAVLPGVFEDVLVIAGGDISWRSPSNIVDKATVRNWT